MSIFYGVNTLQVLYKLLRRYKYLEKSFEEELAKVIDFFYKKNKTIRNIRAGEHVKVRGMLYLALDIIYWIKKIGQR